MGQPSWETAYGFCFRASQRVIDSKTFKMFFSPNDSYSWNEWFSSECNNVLVPIRKQSVTNGNLNTEIFSIKNRLKHFPAKLTTNGFSRNCLPLLMMKLENLVPISRHFTLTGLFILSLSDCFPLTHSFIRFDNILPASVICALIVFHRITTRSRKYHSLFDSETVFRQWVLKMCSTLICAPPMKRTSA